jgi:hypothetical protein
LEGSNLVEEAESLQDVWSIQAHAVLEQNPEEEKRNAWKCG